VNGRVTTLVVDADHVELVFCRVQVALQLCKVHPLDELEHKFFLPTLLERGVECFKSDSWVGRLKTCSPSSRSFGRELSLMYDLLLSLFTLTDHRHNALILVLIIDQGVFSAYILLRVAACIGGVV